LVLPLGKIVTDPHLQPEQLDESLEALFAGEVDDFVSLTDSAARRIATMIGNGTFKPGQRLPPERELAGLLGLSRGALREALRTLESVGLLQARVGSGRHVTASRVDDPAGGLSVWMQLQPVGDVIALRRILEPVAIMAIPATRLAATAAQTRDLFEHMEKAYGARKHEVATTVHTQFHLTLVQFAPTRLHSVLLASMIKAVESAQLEIFRTPGAGAQSLEEHRPMVEALEEGRVEEAAAAVANHLTPVFAFSLAPEGEES
jgi:GntR family transcriptional repressor for pyruvate dehydrogenase complex